MTIASRLIRPWPTALSLSLAANAFLVGLVIWQAGPHHPPRPGEMLDIMMKRMDDALPDKDAAILRNAMEAARPDRAGEEKERQTFHDQLRRILRTEPFDEAAFGEAFARMDADMRGHHERFQAGLLQALRAMSPEGRRAFADVEPP